MIIIAYFAGRNFNITETVRNCEIDEIIVD